MAITRIWQAGFELAGTAAQAFECTAMANSPSSSNARTGTYCSLMAGSASNYKIHSPLSQARIGCWILVTASLSAATRDTLWVYDIVSASYPARVQFDFANFQWIVLCGATQVAVQSDTSYPPLDAYTHIAVDFKLHATTGWVYIYKNGTQIIGYDGQTDQGASTFQRTGWSSVSSSSWGSCYLDDIYLDDTTGEAAPVPPPALRFFPLSPTDSGYSSQFTGSDGDSVNNYALVDEIPPTTSDYVYDETAGHIDAYTLSNLTLPPNGQINAVIPMAYCNQEVAGGVRALKLGTRVGGANATGSAKTMTTGHTLQWERQTTKPGGGSWADADVDGAEVVLEIS